MTDSSATEVVDRDGRFWTQDCVNAEQGWFPYPKDDPYLTLGELTAQHGPLTPAVHIRRDAPGPAPGPLPGVCASCGGTGEVHGPGGNGNWTGVACGCETDICGTCLDPWPCYGASEAERAEAEA